MLEGYVNTFFLKSVPHILISKKNFKKNGGELNGVSYNDPGTFKKYARCAQMGEIF